jgi:hypothetical protein
MSELAWEAALEIVVAKTKHEKFRALAADSHPHHQATRQQLLAMADPTKYTYAFHPPQTYNPSLPPSKLGAADYPSTGTMARNLWREIKAFVRSGGKLAPKALRLSRLAVCEPCEKWDSAQRRCRACGCKMDAKTYSLVAKCPLDKWPKQERVAS